MAIQKFVVVYRVQFWQGLPAESSWNRTFTFYPTCSIPHPIMLEEHEIECVQEFTYLGILLSSHLSWSKYINNECNKARRLLGLIFRRFGSTSSCETLRKLYISYVRPHLEYAAPLWDLIYSLMFPALNQFRDLLTKSAWNGSTLVVKICCSNLNFHRFKAGEPIPKTLYAI